MGFSKPLDYTNIEMQIRKAATELYSPYNDGFVQWSVKQDLYKIKFLLDDIIKNSPKFSNEDEFLKEIEKDIMWKELKK